MSEKCWYHVDITCCDGSLMHSKTRCVNRDRREGWDGRLIFLQDCCCCCFCSAAAESAAGRQDQFVGTNEPVRKNRRSTLLPTLPLPHLAALSHADRTSQYHPYLSPPKWPSGRGTPSTFIPRDFVSSKSEHLYSRLKYACTTYSKNSNSFYTWSIEKGCGINRGRKWGAARLQPDMANMWKTALQKRKQMGGNSGGK